MVKDALLLDSGKKIALLQDDISPGLGNRE